eukprot:274547-Hanusia_phi.AAC.1
MLAGADGSEVLMSRGVSAPGQDTVYREENLQENLDAASMIHGSSSGVEEPLGESVQELREGDEGGQGQASANGEEAVEAADQDQINAATKIQARARGIAERKKVVGMKAVGISLTAEDATKSAGDAASLQPIHTTRDPDMAAMKIQARARGMIARRMVNEKKKRYKRRTNGSQPAKKPSDNAVSSAKSSSNTAVGTKKHRQLDLGRKPNSSNQPFEFARRNDEVDTLFGSSPAKVSPPVDVGLSAVRPQDEIERLNEEIKTLSEQLDQSRRESLQQVQEEREKFTKLYETFQEQQLDIMRMKPYVPQSEVFSLNFDSKFEGIDHIKLHSELIEDLALALDLKPSCISIKSVQAANSMVEFIVAWNASPDGRSCLEIFDQLKEQCSTDGSALKKGRHTCRTTSCKKLASQEKQTQDSLENEMNFMTVRIQSLERELEVVRAENYNFEITKRELQEGLQEAFSCNVKLAELLGNARWCGDEINSSLVGVVSGIKKELAEIMLDITGMEAALVPTTVVPSYETKDLPVINTRNEKFPDF